MGGQKTQLAEPKSGLQAHDPSGHSGHSPGKLNLWPECQHEASVDLTGGAHGEAENGIDIPDPTSDTRSMLPTKYSV